MPPQRGGGGRKQKEPAARDDVVPMTAQLFALGTKNPHNTVSFQEELLQDRFVLIRHGERQDHVDRAWKGNNLLPLYDPPLSNTGRKQSFETALKYFALQQEKKVEQRIQGTFTAILVSPFHRCLETALILNLVAFEGSLAMFVDPQLSDWQQSKVFRSAPTLGGYYTFHEGEESKPHNDKGRPRMHGNDAGTVGSASGNRSLVFKPQHEALKAALEPFVQARAGEWEALAETHKVTAEVAAAWTTHLDVWLANHETLPVWTSEVTEAAIAAQLEQAKVEQPGEARNGSQTGGGGLSRGRKGGGHQPKAGTPGLAASTADAAAYTQCGVPHPEGKADLQRRCQQVEQTHFQRNETSLGQIPAFVRAAVAKEQKEKLPKYFQVYDMRPEVSRAKAGPPALLPPMHVMAVTHADVVAGMIDACCPRHLGDASGKSVPYCSVTVLTRHNNYYRIPPVEERAAASGSDSGGGGQGRGRGRGRGGGKGSSQPTPSRSATGRPGTSNELPVDWQVGVVGSTDLLLTTRVVLQFG